MTIGLPALGGVRRRRRSRRRHLGVAGGAGVSASTSRGRLVLAQALEGGLPNHAVGGPSGELDLGDELGLDPMDVGPFCGAPIAGEWRLLSPPRPSAAAAARLTFVGAESGADAAHIDEMVAAVDADQQRAEPAVRRVVQPPMTTSWPARHFDFIQVSAASRDVGRVGLLGDDAFQRQPAGRSQDGFAAGLECSTKRMSASVAIASSSSCSRSLRSVSGSGAQILAVVEQQIEGEEDQVVGPVLRQGRLKRGEIRRAIFDRARRSRRR